MSADFDDLVSQLHNDPIYPWLQIGMTTLSFSLGAFALVWILKPLQARARMKQVIFILLCLSCICKAAFLVCDGYGNWVERANRIPTRLLWDASFLSTYTAYSLFAFLLLSIAVQSASLRISTFSRRLRVFFVINNVVLLWLPSVAFRVADQYRNEELLPANRAWLLYFAVMILFLNAVLLASLTKMINLIRKSLAKTSRSTGRTGMTGETWSHFGKSRSEDAHTQQAAEEGSLCATNEIVRAEENTDPIRDPSENPAKANRSKCEAISNSTKEGKDEPAQDDPRQLSVQPAPEGEHAGEEEAERTTPRRVQAARRQRRLSVVEIFRTQKLTNTMQNARLLLQAMRRLRPLVYTVAFACICSLAFASVVAVDYFSEFSSSSGRVYLVYEMALHFCHLIAVGGMMAVASQLKK